MSDAVLSSPGGRRGAALLGSVALLVASGCSSAEDVIDADASRGTVTTSNEGTTTPVVVGGGCDDEQGNSAAGPDHVDPGAAVDYDGVPPVSGIHWAQWPDISKPVYVAEERPELGELVHSQEHGWTFIWYDDSVAADEQAMEDLGEVAEGLDDRKTVAIPWTSDDGGALPDGKHIAITYWSVKGGPDGTEWRQFCTSADADTIRAFTERHPPTDALEPNAP